MPTVCFSFTFDVHGTDYISVEMSCRAAVASYSQSRLPGSPNIIVETKRGVAQTGKVLSNMSHDHCIGPCQARLHLTRTARLHGTLHLPVFLCLTLSLTLPSAKRPEGCAARAEDQARVISNRHARTCASYHIPHRQTLPGLPRAARPSGRFAEGKTPQRGSGAFNMKHFGRNVRHYSTCCLLVRFSHIGSIEDAARDGPCAHGNVRQIPHSHIGMTTLDLL